MTGHGYGCAPCGQLADGGCNVFGVQRRNAQKRFVGKKTTWFAEQRKGEARSDALTR
jgi:hypothetical protein